MINNNHCLALLAHVDAGKTTLSESILFNTGSIRKAGRVDHRDSFLDTETEERERGITIFSKQALFNIGNSRFTLIDTPGHTDFSAETERVLSVIDLAVLIVSAADGIHGHDLTLWKLTELYKVPTLIFVNKTDQPGTDSEKVLAEIKKNFREACVDFSILDKDGSFAFPDETEKNEFYESVAVLDDEATEHFFEHAKLDTSEIIRLFKLRKLHPVCFGSALKNEGVDRLLALIELLSPASEYPDEFAAKVFKITHDQRGKRLTHIRICGGELKPKDVVKLNHRSGIASTDEKIDRIVVYSGTKAEQAERAEAGMAVCVEGPESAMPGDTLGNEPPGSEMLMTPLFTAGVSSPDIADVHKLYSLLKEIETEIPEISVGFSKHTREIGIKLMGEIQTDIIKSIVRERYDIALNFTPSSIVYKETIAAPVICAGHFEPLRHYAEVHLLMEPAERGSGIEIVSQLSEDVLPRHFQRLIMSDIAEKKHIGALVGAELTDVRISLINAKAHEKHTEGGDFREASWRAVRYGLMKSKAAGTAVLLEPYYEFELTVPDANVGRAMNDLANIAESFDGPELMNGQARFTGRAAVSKISDYAAETAAYTGGFGRLSLSFGGYGKCIDAESVVADKGYEPELDLDNQGGSVFCTHGAGYYVPWYEADSYFHLDLKGEELSLRRALEADRAEQASLGENGIKLIKHYDLSKYTSYYEESSERDINISDKNKAKSLAASQSSAKKQDYLGAGLREDKELEEIFYRSLGGNRGRNADKSYERTHRAGDAVKKSIKGNAPGEDGHVEIKAAKKQYLLVDGYNIIFAWEELNELAALNIDAARAALIDVLANYQGFKGMTLILVFDAYKVKGNHGSIEKYHNIYVVYTKEAQTADAYIEKTVHEIGKKERVTVATSDGLEQTIVFGEGAVRMSARELYEDVRSVQIDIRRDYTDKSSRLRNTLESYL